MDKLVPLFYKRYGISVNSNRMFPSINDGLKPVERRVLLSVFKVARDKFSKSSKIDGYCIGNYHPHGSAYGTIVQLANQGFLDKQGNFGSNVGVDPSPPAAMRYTECKLNKLTYDLAFKLIDYVDFVDSEVPDNKEPVALPTMLPFCLVGNYETVGIGFGYRTTIPVFEVKDLVRRLKALVSNKNRKPLIKPKLNFEILSSDRELEKLLETGVATIKVRGRYKINKKDKSVEVYSWPSQTFTSILNKLSSYLNSGKVGFTDLSSKSTKIVFKLLVKKEAEKILSNFVKDLDSALTGNINYVLNIVGDNDNIITCSVDDFLLYVYQRYKSISVKSIDAKINKFKEQIDDLLVIQKIKPIIKKKLNNETTNVIEEIAKESKVNLDKVRNVISKYSIHKLLYVKTDINELNDKIKKLESDKNNIDKILEEEYDNLSNIN